MSDNAKELKLFLLQICELSLNISCYKTKWGSQYYR